MTSKAQAKQAYTGIAINWLRDERRDYDFDSDDCEDPDEIPIAELEAGNYKDLRILEDYFCKEDDLCEIEKLRNEITELKKNQQYKEFAQLINGLMWYDEGHVEPQELWDFIQNDCEHQFSEVNQEDKEEIFETFCYNHYIHTDENGEKSVQEIDE